MSEAAPSGGVPASALDPTQRMRIAYVLTLVGGYLDAYTYFKRGGVFANAQTGNIVKLGIALSNGASDTYLSFLLPIAAFTLGLIVALGAKEMLMLKKRRLVRRSVLVAEMCGLAIVGFIPLSREWDMLANCIVSFVAAMQYETFTTFRGDAIVTTMSTGNLRKFVDCIFAGTMRHEPAQLLRAVRFLSIIATFAAGAFVGTRACDLWDKAAVVPAIVLLGVAVIVITVMRYRHKS